MHLLVSHTCESFAVIILAAGSSSRLGSPKQLLVYSGKTLLQTCIDNAKQINANPVILVLGANKKLIEDHTDTKGVIVIENDNWKSGIASSITVALSALYNTFPDTDYIILMVCDQPFADSTILNKLLLKQKETGKSIVACKYEGTKGTPALFHRSLFHELAALKGDSGAKVILTKYENESAYVSFEAGGIDIDTVEDYKNLSK